MKNKILNLLAVAMPLAVMAAVPTATVVQNTPGLINYSGYLVDPATGKKYADGIYTLDVRLWKTATGTAKAECVWGAQYSVFVSGGYFNIMLGESNAADLTAANGVLPTYTRKELWKATWDGEDRYLGITPHEDASGATLETLSEIAPRARFTATPFAFRAQHAASADSSAGDFAVGGNMTVQEGATFGGGLAATGSGTQTLGPIRVSGSQVALSGATSASDTLADIWSVGNLLRFEGYWGNTLRSSNGNITFDIPAGHQFYNNGNGSFVSEVPVNTIGGSGATTIGGGSLTLQTSGGATKYTQDESTIKIEGGSAFNVDGTTAIEMTASGTSTLLGHPAVLTGTSGSGKISAESGTVVGAGSLKWGKSSATKYAPILFRRVSFTISYSSDSVYVDFLAGNTDLCTLYTWRVVGFDGWQNGTPSTTFAPGAVKIELVNSVPKIFIAKGMVYPSSYACYVDVMGVAKTWSE